MANHNRKPSERAKAYWTRHYSKPSRTARKAKRAKQFAEKAA